MRHPRLIVLFGLLLAVICGFSGAPALAVTPFALTATDVTMPSSGTGISHYTITSIPDAGTVTISCLYTGPVSKANIPSCTYNLSFTPIPVTAGQTLTGTVNFYGFGQLPAAGFMLLGGLMLGLGFRRKLWRWLAVAVLALGTLACVSGMNGCGGKGTIMMPTPGTYQYTIYATYVDSVNPTQGTILSTNVNVTVP